MKKYSRVSYEVRCQIDALLQVKLSISEIAKHLGFHKTTIYREIRRNKSSRNKYKPQLAQKKSSKRYSSCRKNYLIKNELKDQIENLLIQGWSPQQISGRLEQEKIFKISHQSIYNVVNKDRFLKTFLRRFYKRGAGRLRQRRRIRSSVNGYHISERPRIVDKENVLETGKEILCTLSMEFRY